MARFYEGIARLRDPASSGRRWAQLFDPAGGVHLNIQAEDWYRRPTWPEEPGELTKMMHFEVQVEDLEASVALALELGGTQAPWQPPDRDLTRMRIMLDPSGHPLCLFLAGE